MSDLANVTPEEREMLINAYTIPPGEMKMYKLLLGEEDKPSMFKNPRAAAEFMIDSAIHYAKEKL